MLRAATTPPLAEIRVSSETVAPEEETFADFHQKQINYRRCREIGEVSSSQRRKSERASQRTERQQNALRYNEQRGYCQGMARLTMLRIMRGANDKDDQRLRRQRLDEPTSVEQGLTGMEKA